MSKELMESIEEKNRRKEEEAAKAMREGMAKDLKREEIARDLYGILNNAQGGRPPLETMWGVDDD